MFIELRSGDERPHVDLRRGALIPRLVSTGPQHATVAVTAGGALLLAGDEVRIEIRVDPGCTLRLEDVGGTVAYGGDARSHWSADISLATDATLVWDALPFVLADDARVDRDTTVRLASGAVACLRETLVFGRTGEEGGSIVASTAASIEGRPLFHESLELDGYDPQIGVLGAHRVMDSALCLGRRHDEAPVPALQLDEPGTIVRALGDQTHLATVESTWRDWTLAARHD